LVRKLKLNISDIYKVLDSKFSDDIEIVDDKFIKVLSSKWYDIALLLKNDNKLKLDYLMCISSYDVGDKKTYGVAYNFKSTSLNHYLEIRIEVTDDESISSISDLWGSADWHEREAYDMMGIKFKNHPNFKRILLSDDWDGHPLRKDYDTPDYYRGMPVPKDKTYWE
jgi:NADH-quinone oxidoreductase subunit C